MEARTEGRHRMNVTRLMSLLVLLLALGAAACNTGNFSASISQVGQSSDASLAPKQSLQNREPDFVLVDRAISQEELEELSPYPVLWPDPVPAGCSLQGIFEMSESPTESTGSGIFILKYRCHLLGRLHIHESLTMSPNLAGREPIDHIDVNGGGIPLYDNGGVWQVFLTIDGVKVELVAQGLSKEEIAAIVSSLRPREG
ncbi:MAG: hypothetical protein ACE5F6_14440 [Anaerolineae bacterium]